VATATATRANAAVHVLGIRHHGPGSARSLRTALAAIGPDCIVIEGPPDADGLIGMAADPGMRPPVALLVYRPDMPRKSAYYPFAEFSPEWQAIRFGHERGIATRFMDLPAQYQLADEEEDAPEPEPKPRLRTDPLQVLAEAAGFADGERWWEYVVEHRRDGTDLFAAIGEAMGEVRSRLPGDPDVREQRREAHMRQTIRQAIAEGHERIAVVCGAWHAPALQQAGWPAAKDDAAVLKGLPKVKVAATWVPWTHGRLAYESGYGAGVVSPGWYHHLWTHTDHIPERWLTKVARLLRDERLDASSASVIEAVRLADCLASLRGRPLAGLDELDEAAVTVLCFGDDVPMRLVRKKLTVGELLGHVPESVPQVPLALDLAAQQRRLKLAAEASQTVKVLDLREATDLDRSRLLHRLNLLGIPWGEVEHAGAGKGTFKEAWRLQWLPEFAVAVIEASLLGTTVVDAATAKADDLAARAATLPDLTRLLDAAVLADLAGAVDRIMRRVEEQAASVSDVAQLLDAVPPLAQLARYSDVRRTDASLVGHVARGLVVRASIGLPNACASLDDDAAAAMFTTLVGVEPAITLLNDGAATAAWVEALGKVAALDTVHGLVSGRAVRLLLDRHTIDDAEAARRMGLAVSVNVEPAKAGAWIDGFLRHSGELLLHDEALFDLVDGWVSGLTAESFTGLLPILRRTFATFEAPLRRNLGEKARDRTGPAARGSRAVATDEPTALFDVERAAAVLPRVAAMLGLVRGEGDRS
jgi:hypothetical protein